MALLVAENYDTPIGTILPSTYWRWTAMDINTTAMRATITLYGYVSKEAFEAGKQSVGQKQYTIAGKEFGQLVLQAPDGATISDAFSNAVYAFVESKDDFFAIAEKA